MANPDIGTLRGFDLNHFSLGVVDSSIAGDVVTVHPDGDYAAGIANNTPYNLAGSGCYFRLNHSPGSAINSNEVFVGLLDVNTIAYGFGSAQNIVGWYLTGDGAGTGCWLQPVCLVGGNDHSPDGGPFVSPMPIYLRTRETGGTTYWESSPDGVAWDPQYSSADLLTGPQMGALYFSLCAGFWNAAGGDTSVTQTFDAFNGGAPAGSSGDFFGFFE